MPSLIKSPLELLLPYQAKWVADNSRFKAGIWSRQSGKDFSTAAEAVKDAFTRAKTTWMIAAPSERQAMESLGKCKEWAEAFSVAMVAEEIERQGGANTLLKSGSITFANGSRILAVPGRPDTVRGFSANLVLTEFAFFEDPDATWRAVLPSITNPLRGGEKKVRLITTPNGKSGRGARTYKILADNLLNPVEGRKQHWSCHVVTISDAVADGLPIDVDELRESLDDPLGWAQEYMCEFLDSSNVLLPYDLLAPAESSEATVNCDPGLFDSGNHDLRLGIDFGRSNDPTVCWTLERVGDVLVTREVLVLRNKTVPEQVEILRHRVKAAKRVCYDYTGVGIGMGDVLVKEFQQWRPEGHQFGKIELCVFTAAFKRLIFPRLRQAFEAPVRVRIPIDVEIREDLHSMNQIFRGADYTYEAPHTKDGHSDRCTALALALRASEGAVHRYLPVTGGRAFIKGGLMGGRSHGSLFSNIIYKR